MEGMQYNTERQQERRYVIPSLAMLAVKDTVKDVRQYKTLERLEIAVERELQRTEIKNDRAISQLNNFGKNFLGMYPCVNGRELSRDGDKAFMVNVEDGRELNVGEIQVRSNDGKYQMVADIDGVQIAKGISSKCYEEFLSGGKNERMKLFASTFDDVKIGQTEIEGSRAKLLSMGYDNAFDYPCDEKAKMLFVRGQIEKYNNDDFNSYLRSNGINVDVDKGTVTLNTGHNHDGEPIDGKKDSVVKIGKGTAKTIVGGKVTGDVLDIENRLALLKNSVVKLTKDKDVLDRLDKVSFEGAVNHSCLSVKGVPRDIEGHDGEKAFLLLGKGREINPQLLESISKAGVLRDRMTGRNVYIESLRLVQNGVDAKGNPLYVLKGLVDGREVEIALSKSQAVDLMKYNDLKRIEMLQKYTDVYFVDNVALERFREKYNTALAGENMQDGKSFMDVEHVDSGKTRVSLSWGGREVSAEISERQSQKMMAVGNEQRGHMLAQIFSKAGLDLKTMSFEEMGRMYMDKYIGKETAFAGNTTEPDKYVSNAGSSTGVKANVAAAMASAAFSQSMGEGQSVSRDQGVGRGM